MFVVALACVFLSAFAEAKLEAIQSINIKPSGQLTHEKIKLVRLSNGAVVCI